MKKKIGMLLIVLLALVIAVQAISTIPVAVQIYKAKINKDKLYYNAEVFTEEEAKIYYPCEDNVEYIGLQFADWFHSIEGMYNYGSWYARHKDDEIRFVIIPVGTIFKKDCKEVYIWLQDIVNGIKLEGILNRITYRFSENGWELDRITRLTKP